MDALATEKQLAQAHASLYIHEPAAQSPKEGTVQVDLDTSMNPHYQAACALPVLP
jgi:hypothetical protein